MIFKTIKPDKNGVISFHTDIEEKEVHNPFLVALQAMVGKRVYYDYIDNDTCLIPKYFSMDEILNGEINSENVMAAQWLVENVEYKDDCAFWKYDYEAVYLDIMLQPGWKSAYAQAYVILAMLFLYSKTKKIIYSELADKAVNGLVCSVDSGGVCRYFDNGEIWFEEIPGERCTYIFNAHIVAILALIEHKNRTGIDKYNKIINCAVDTLISHLYWFDTGTYSAYDISSIIDASIMLDFKTRYKKHVSIYIGELTLKDNYCSHKLNLCENSCFDESIIYISGVDWESDLYRNKLRRIAYGRGLRTKNVVGGGIQNTFLNLKNIAIDGSDDFILSFEYCINRNMVLILRKNTEKGYVELGGEFKVRLKRGHGKKEISIPKKYLLKDTTKVYHEYHIELLKELVKSSNNLDIISIKNRFEQYHSS